jgi:hypothetical protein
LISLTHQIHLPLPRPAPLPVSNRDPY